MSVKLNKGNVLDSRKITTTGLPTQIKYTPKIEKKKLLDANSEIFLEYVHSILCNIIHEKYFTTAEIRLFRIFNHLFKAGSVNI